MRKPSEKRGELYLGAEYDASQGQIKDQPAYLDADDLVTHGVCIGMTGSGKTGLCISLLEECALADVPVLIIDPKGDLTNLSLVFPELKQDDFLPWVEEEAARRAGQSKEEYAAAEAAKWKSGLADWGIGSERLRRLKDAAAVTVFTPGSSAGTSLNVLSSFDPPDDAASMDPELLRELIAGTVSALLGLLGDDSPDPQDRSHILLSTILEKRWLDGRETQLTDLIHLIQSPPFKMLGAISLESFYPQDERRKLAFELNSLIASPSFKTWLEGEPLDIEKMLRTADGLPRMSICTISHLSDAERMFFVSLLLNQFVTWMRRQSGTSSLRALLYFDEIFGYLPPYPKNPPSKQLLMTILKQGRAFGASAMLVTQNPVDLDYKALSNCGVWLLGKLQTQQDKDRILDGLEGAIHEAGGDSDHSSLDAALSALGSRVFLMHNIHGKKPLTLHSRWAMSYLAGPMTRSQIRKLTEGQATAVAASDEKSPDVGSLDDFIGSGDQTDVNLSGELLNVPTSPPPGLNARFVAAAEVATYQASLYAMATIVFRDRSSSDVLKCEVTLVITPAVLGEDGVGWSKSQQFDELVGSEKPPAGNAKFAPLPGAAAAVDFLKELGSEIVPYLVENYSVNGFACNALDLKSKLGESEEEFRQRVASTAEEKKLDEEDKLREKADKKIASLQKKIDKETAELERDLAKAETRRSEEMMSTVANVGSTLLSLFNSRSRSSAASKIGTAIKRFSTKRGMTQRAELEVEESKQVIAAAQQEIDGLLAQLADELVTLRHEIDAQAKSIDQFPIRPYKSNVEVQEFGYLWRALQH